MSERDEYPAGVPCWVEGLHRDVPAALAFYGPLLGWELIGSGGEDEYFVARLRGRDVAGIAPMPPAAPGVDGMWMTHVRVDRVAETAERAVGAGGTVVAGPMELPPVGSLVVLADPAGARLCAWEPTARRGAQLVNEPGAWAMSFLHTTEPEGASAFYGAVFGWEPEPYGPVTLWRLRGYVGGEPQQPVPRDVVAVMAPLPAGGGSAPHWRPDFWVGDADGTARHAAELGGRVLQDPYDVPGFRQAVLADPRGAAFTISQLVLPGG